MYAICAFSQEEDDAPRTYVDTIHVNKNTLIIGSDSVYFMKNDTVMYVQDTIKTKIDSLLRQQKDENEDEFYENLTKKEDSSSLRKKIIDLLIDSPSGEEKSDSTLSTTDRHLSNDVHGKILGEVSIKALDVFGPSVNDTTSDKTSGISRLANRIHINTREHVIRNRLLLKKGEVLTYARLLDNERILRALPYIRDARFIVESVSGDTVNLLLITQDLISYTVSGEPSGLDGGSVGLNNINILGYGHQLYNTIKLDTDRQRKFGYIGEYHMPNIGTTQTYGILSYQNTEYEQNYRLSLDRSFLTPGIRFAGGVFLEHRRAFTYAPWINSYELLYAFENEEDIPRHLHKSFTQDYWIGRSFKPDFITRYDSRARLVVALRYHHKKYTERPPVTNDVYKAFHNRHLFLMSLGFSRSNFTTERQVYGYGITEDIPLGETAEIVLGPEKGEFYNRFFTGIRLAKGKYIPPVGYLSAGFRLGGYWYNKQMEDGVLQFTANTFSYPILWKRTTYRLFFNADYSQGIQPIDKENFWENMISLNDEEGIRGLSSYRMFGYQRLAFSLETVAYLPYNFYSFRMATFVFADAGTIAQRDETLLEGRFYQGYGIGFRIRNDRLAFKTFELRLAGYPAPPIGESAFKISISGIPVPRLLDFNVRKPDTFNFE
ncbi:BamA/TamA family outer membrane protein [Catalinimonas niigatensis]|uniref:hypothetical protein n=1 Tax=Catalinimonas niigatensis TaxID=1397264 RepID=UPI002664E9A5|nr:hypothetical protein [Catalinimonas niigatensis]WPP49588.1 hypothetical protein PZB72_23220 [Catalinimonas niigatensis]